MAKTIIVTGGSRGIGAGIVKLLAEEDNNIVLNYNKSEENAKKIQKECTDLGKNVEIFKADVTKREEVRRLVEFTIQKYKKIDVLINNAGISQSKLFTEVTDEEWRYVIDNNLTSVFYMSQEVVPHMIQQQSGCIINISSIWGMVGSSCESVYSVSKAGVDGLTKALAKELGPSHIRVNSIAPGLIDTQMNQDLSEKVLEEIKEETPLGKIGTPEDIAKCVKWLIEDEFTTGQIISSNGGWDII